MVNWFLTRMPRQFNVERIIFSTNGTETIIHIQTKQMKSDFDVISYTKKITQSGLNLNKRAKSAKLLEKT